MAVLQQVDSGEVRAEQKAVVVVHIGNPGLELRQITCLLQIVLCSIEGPLQKPRQVGADIGIFLQHRRGVR